MSPSSTTSSSSSSPSTTSSSSPSTSATATVDPADLPADARKHTPEGAVAFVKYYLEQINEAWTKPSVGLLPPLSDDGCLSCKGFEKTANDLVTKKQRYASTPSSFTSVKAFPGAPSGRQYVRVIGTQHKVDIVDSQGRVVSTDPQEKIAATTMAIWKGGRWLLYDMG